MNFKNAEYIVVSVIGAHAGEEIKNIFSRKQREIVKTGKTYWLVKSFKSKTEQIQKMCKEARKKKLEVYCLFIEASSKNGAKPTVHNILVKEISKNMLNWEKLHHKITGKVDKQSTAMVIDEMEVFNQPTVLDFWNYSEFTDNNPVKLQLGASTVCCIKRKSKGMVSRFRNIVAVAKLPNPYAVWVR